MLTFFSLYKGAPRVLTNEERLKLYRKYLPIQWGNATFKFKPEN